MPPANGGFYEHTNKFYVSQKVRTSRPDFFNDQIMLETNRP